MPEYAYDRHNYMDNMYALHSPNHSLCAHSLNHIWNTIMIPTTPTCKLLPSMPWRRRQPMDKTFGYAQKIIKYPKGEGVHGLAAAPGHGQSHKEIQRHPIDT
jgi:hypothetical protein